MKVLKDIFISLIIFGFVFIQAGNAQAPNITWQKSLGGTGGDYLQSIQQTTDGVYIVAGSSNSTDSDYWIVKLDDVPTGINKVVGKNEVFLVYPNPTSGLFNISLNNVAGETAAITNAIGQIIYKNKLETNNTSIDLSNYPKGVYSVRILEKDKTVRIILQ